MICGEISKNVVSNKKNYINLKNKFYHRLVDKIPLPGKGFLDKHRSKWTIKGFKGVYRLSQMIPEKNINIGDDKYFAWCTFAHILTVEVEDDVD